MGKWRASLASAQPFENEARLRRAANGEYRWFLIQGAPLRDELASVTPVRVTLLTSALMLLCVVVAITAITRRVTAPSGGSITSQRPTATA
jgi:hypothetical protein